MPKSDRIQQLHTIQDQNSSYGKHIQKKEKQKQNVSLAMFRLYRQVGFIQVWSLEQSVYDGRIAPLT